MYLDYKTIKTETIAKIEVEKSKFICYFNHCEDEDAAKEYISIIKKNHPKAKHHCYAYIYNNTSYYKTSDDGEPSGSAGMPILKVLKSNNFNNVITVVVRYFGGTLLGKGGLVKAYSNVTIEAMNQADIIYEGYRPSYKILIDISIYNALEQTLNNPNLKIIAKEFKDQVEVTVLLIGDYDINKIIELTNGKAIIIDNGLILYTYKKAQ